MVSNLGMHPQRPRRTHPLRRPRLLRRLVELRNLGPIRPRLEPSRPQLPPPTRLPFQHLDFPTQQTGRDIRDVPFECFGARDVYGADL